MITNRNIDSFADSQANAMTARTQFNEFMAAAAASGHLGVQHIRVGARQPSTEVFARKAAVALNEFSPKVEILASVVDVRSLGSTGPSTLGEAAAVVMRADPRLERYLGSPRDFHASKLTPSDEREVNLVDLFDLLSAQSHFEAGARLSNAPALAGSMVSAASALTGSSAGDEGFRFAADSVYSQSLADVHAISLIAAFDGKPAALRVLEEVCEIREAAGDFGRYSMAPLSQDTKAALTVLRASLQGSQNYQAMTRDEVWDNSKWIASEGVAAWMQSKGAEYSDVNKISLGMDATQQMAATPVLGKQAQAKASASAGKRP
jgi:hypothetical protein